jgi:dipeptidyl aminopeptidase/acylaminoacyl peptidase/polyisoprenoid-binding protein YceI
MGPLPRRALAAVAAVAVLAGGGWLFLASRDAPPTARLRPGDGAGGSGSPDGTWVVAPEADGFVGYRVRERLGSISAPNDVVGRSPGVSGTVTIAGGAVTGAEVTVDMTRLRTDVEPRDGRMRDEGLETARFPTASFRLREPVPLGDVSGARVVELRLPGSLTLHGVTRPLDVPVQARWDGDSIQVAGGTRIRRADFDLEVPTLAGYRIEDTAVVELELTLVREGAALAGPVSTLRRATAVPQPGGEEPGRPQAEPCRGGGRLPEGGGRLLFSAITDDDTEHLFTIGADGRGLRRVGDDDAGELDPAWSPDGRRIAYARAEPFQFSPPPSVHLARPDGSGRRDLTPGQPSFQPDWSPDGRRIALTVTGAMETTEISIVDLQGSPVALFGDTPTSDSEPRWSPDGRRLAVSAYGGPGNDDVALIDPATGRFRRLTDSPGYEHSPAWSPDGRRIAYVKDGAVHVMRADGSADRPLTRGRKDAAPAWSPDGRRLTFVRDGNLFITRPDGSGATCVRTGMLLTSGARWQPAS